MSAATKILDSMTDRLTLYRRNLLRGRWEFWSALNERWEEFILPKHMRGISEGMVRKIITKNNGLVMPFCTVYVGRITSPHLPTVAMWMETNKRLILREAATVLPLLARKEQGKDFEISVFQITKTTSAPLHRLPPVRVFRSSAMTRS